MAISDWTYLGLRSTRETPAAESAVRHKRLHVVHSHVHCEPIVSRKIGIFRRTERGGEDLEGKF